MAEIDNRYARAGYGARTDVAIDEGLRAYMLRVYNYMALGVAGTAVVTLLLINNPAVTRRRTVHAISITTNGPRARPTAAGPRSR